MNADVAPAVVASDLWMALERLLRRLRTEHVLPLPHAAVLGRLDRDGAQTVSDLARAERVRPQSIAQSVRELEARGLVRRRPDLRDRRRALIELTHKGDAELWADRDRREGWLAHEIERGLSLDEQATLARAVARLGRLADS